MEQEGRTPWMEEETSEEETGKTAEAVEEPTVPAGGGLFLIVSSKRGQAAKVFIIGALALLLFSVVINSYVQLNKAYLDISEAQTQLSKLRSENVRMQTELEGKASISNIKEYAENYLGMQQLDKSQIEYIEIQTEDSVEVVEEDQNIFIRIKNWFEDFVAYLQG